VNEAAGALAWDRRTRDEDRGAATFLLVGVLAVLLVVAWAAAVIAAYQAAAHQARSAADSAALSGAMAFSQGADGCSAAEELARANRTRLVSCEQVGDQLDYVVAVRVQLRLRPAVVGLPRFVEAGAYAGKQS